ncbi:HalOD1 output domain-containing protein [Natrialba aegyptia]|uniref:HalOD1 output domain-containing protein n=1 Tax=Natrialba aegyptia TaxID=129789 RepID=UPI001F4D1F30|nr:HalOD1 output domain-containing protein [Natrialba aegyptia]
MAQRNASLSTQVVFTVAKVIGEDPAELPPLQKTISSEALNNLFREDTSLPGAYLVFPYCDVWGLFTVIEPLMSSRSTQRPLPSTTFLPIVKVNQLTTRW